MALKEQLLKLATEKNTPCVTISLNTHRTHPDSIKDDLMLKNFLKEAEERVIAEYGKRPVESLLEKIESVATEIDLNHNLDSLHIFLSNDTKEIIKSSWETTSEGVQISDSFDVRSIIKSYNRSEEYLLMLVSQSGVQLYEALNDEIVKEINNDDFPFSENRHYNTNAEKGSDSKHLDDLVREFLNKVDKALVKVNNETDLNCVVICTVDNYTRLQQVADKPSIYLGYAAIDYNNTATHQIVKQSWEIVQELQQERRAKAIEEVKEAVGQGKVLTDLNEIYEASIDGRGELLIVHQDFKQPVIMKDERTFDLTDDGTAPNAIDDITSNIAWEVLSKKGKVFFTSNEEIKDLGEIVLKTRY
ncbi:MAG: baeRF3 domain-containing protein [Flavitalea sp.]